MVNIEEYPRSDLDREETALLVIDVQRGFTDEECTFARRGMDLSMIREAMPSVRSVVDTAREADIPVAFTRIVRREDGKDAPGEVFDIRPAAYQQYGQTTLREGMNEVEYADGVEPHGDEYEVTKQLQNAFHGTRLETYLRTEGVETLLVCGFVSNVCVESTIRGAHERGFDVVLVEDACASYDQRMHEALVHNVEYIYGISALAEHVPGLLGVSQSTPS
jgi:ureidoacrylate peracid hydrolase